jgi:two-component system, NtrC family, nitrogen regulation sensor histidine kinase NtrY
VTISSDNTPTISPSEPRTSHVSGLVGTITVALALTLALVTFLVLAGLTPLSPTHSVVVWLFIGNILLVALLLGIVTWEAIALMRARRARAAAAGLHVRVVGLFSLVAALPAILVAVVASVTLERGLDPWFTSTIKGLVSNTVDIARAYREVQCRAMTRETSLMAADIDRARNLYEADRKLFRDFMLSRAVFLGFPVALIVARDGTVTERIEARPIDGLSPPNLRDVQDVGERDALCLIPTEGNVFRSLIRLSAFDGSVLYVARQVDPRAVEFLPAAEAGVAYYQALEAKKAGIQIAFASMFALIALIVLLSAVWFGLNFANKLVAPIRRLIHATDQVAFGNFYVQVPVRRSEGDLAHLGETFNKMTSELRHQRDDLVQASDGLDKRRRFTEAVLAGVSAGVIGLDDKCEVTLLNPSALALMVDGIDQSVVGRSIDAVLPEIAALVSEASHTNHRLTHGQVSVTRGGRDRTLNVRVTREHATGEDGGLVVTLDDITDLVAAQRTSAWADVARRIAHEIKNPLTPIQLSAERIKRKYGRVIVEDREIFEQCTDTIVRQVDEIKRMVDEFSSFARMPKPTPENDDLVETVRQVLFLMRVGNPEFSFVERLPAKLIARFDRRLISQALTNIVKNATEAVMALPQAQRASPRVIIAVELSKNDIVTIDITDNGKGFPADNRQRLLEPYMTTRDGGTGLGLPIVAKIFEDHGGGIELLDPSPQDGHGGRVRLWFPQSGASVGTSDNSTQHSDSRTALMKGPQA